MQVPTLQWQGAWRGRVGRQGGLESNKALNWPPRLWLPQMRSQVPIPRLSRVIKAAGKQEDRLGGPPCLSPHWRPAPLTSRALPR